MPCRHAQRAANAAGANVAAVAADATADAAPRQMRAATPSGHNFGLTCARRKQQTATGQSGTAGSGECGVGAAADCGSRTANGSDCDDRRQGRRATTTTMATTAAARRMGVRAGRWWCVRRQEKQRTRPDGGWPATARGARVDEPRTTWACEDGRCGARNRCVWGAGAGVVAGGVVAVCGAVGGAAGVNGRRRCRGYLRVL